MALTSSSTYQNALDQLNDNLAWDGNASKVADALEAVRWLLVNRPETASGGSQSATYSHDALEALEDKLTEAKKRLGVTQRSHFVRGRCV